MIAVFDVTSNAMVNGSIIVYPQEGCRRFLRNSGAYVPDHTATNLTILSGVCILNATIYTTNCTNRSVHAKLTQTFLAFYHYRVKILGHIMSQIKPIHTIHRRPSSAKDVSCCYLSSQSAAVLHTQENTAVCSGIEIRRFRKNLLPPSSDVL